MSKITSPRALALLLSTALPAALPAVASAQTISAPTLQKLDGITHGPQLGNVTPTSIRVWARTKAPGPFRVLYSTNSDLSGGTLSPEVKTTWENDATGWAELKGLQPNTKYYYALVQNGQVADSRVNGRINSFLTLPDAAGYRDPKLNPKGLFNFAFEIGTGNNQASKDVPETYARMLTELKDKIYFQIQNGDWIYEVGRDKTEAQWAAENRVTRQPRITALAQGVAGVWENYKQYLKNDNLANFYREVPLFVTLDDHEILNDVTGSGQIGYRIDARGKPFQENIRQDSVSNEVERAVFRDPALAAWRDYVGWSNPDTGNPQLPYFGTTKLTAGSSVLSDPATDFRKLELAKANNLHVLWGQGNTGVYRIKRVIDAHRIEVEPPLTVSEQARYSIGAKLYSKFRVGNADFFLLDTRSQRTLHDKANLTDPKTSMIGAEQKAWLFENLRNSDADFVFVTSSVNLAVPHDNGAWYGQGSGGQSKDDGWTAHLHERAELLNVATSLGKPVFFLTGDLHKSFVARIAPGVYDVASGPHTSSNHRIGDAGGSPPSGVYQSGDRQVNVLWSSNQYRNDSGGSSSTAVNGGWPVYTVIRLNNAFNIPTPEGKARWIAHPEPQAIFEFRDGKSGDLLFAHSVSTSEAKASAQPVSLEHVKVLGGIDN